jgi:RNA polymerase sigma factor FliA
VSDDSGPLLRKPAGSSPHFTNQAGERRNALVLRYLPLVKTIAFRVLQSLPRHVDLDDLVQAGTVGLMSAAAKYDDRQQATFSTYAKHRILGAILDSLREQDTMSRDMRGNYKRVERAIKTLEATLQRTPTDVEVAAHLGMDIQRLRKLLLLVRSSDQISASTAANKDQAEPDFPAAPEERPDAICAQMRLRCVLGDVLKTLPDRQQKILKLYYVEELTMKEIGAVFGINESRVSQIHKAAVGVAGEKLRARGIHASAA